MAVANLFESLYISGERKIQEKIYCLKFYIIIFTSPISLMFLSSNITQQLTYKSYHLYVIQRPSIQGLKAIQQDEIDNMIANSYILSLHV